MIHLDLAHSKQLEPLELRICNRKTFILPEILFDPALILSPHVFLLAILFRHEAFDSDDLNNNPHRLSELDIHPEASELPFHIKEEMKDRFIFRQCEKLSTGWEMCEKPITPGMMGATVKRIGRILGFKRNTICYSLRYMAGNNLNESGMYSQFDFAVLWRTVPQKQHMLNIIDGVCDTLFFKLVFTRDTDFFAKVTISSDLRNLTLDHSFGGDTFQKHYLSRFVRADLWAIHRNLQPQNELLKQVASHGSSTDARQPISLTRNDLEQLKSDPMYVRLTDKLFKLRKGTPERRKLSS